MENKENAGYKGMCEEKTEGGFPLERQMKGQLKMTATSDSRQVNDGQRDGGAEKEL